jgi:hypothetical protein
MVVHLQLLLLSVGCLGLWIAPVVLGFREFTARTRIRRALQDNFMAEKGVFQVNYMQEAYLSRFTYRTIPLGPIEFVGWLNINCDAKAIEVRGRSLAFAEEDAAAFDLAYVKISWVGRTLGTGIAIPWLLLQSQDHKVYISVDTGVSTLGCGRKTRALYEYLLRAKQQALLERDECVS